MKMQCTKKNLNAGLQICSRIIGGGNALPILNNILLRTEKGRLKLTTTNLEMAVNTWVGGKVVEDGELTVPAKLLNELVANLLTEKLTISTEKTDLLLEGENAKTHINGLGVEDFPLIPGGEGGVYTKLSGKALREGIGEVGFAAAFSETQPEISGVLFSFEGKGLTLATTDRYRLAEVKIPLGEEVGSNRQVIVPTRAVNEASRSMGEGTIEVFLKEGQICLRTEEVELISRLIEGQYPDYKQIVPQNFTTQAELKRGEFVQALKAASLFAGDTNNIELELNPPGKQVVIKSQAVQVGGSEIRLFGELTGEKNAAVFNYRYLLECLNNLPDEQVSLRVINSSSPAALVPAGRDNYLYIVMPIKI